MAKDTPNRPDHPNLAFFPEPLIQLNREIEKHPALIIALQEHPAKEWEVRLAQICQYCGIAINGTFDAEGIAYIAEQCIKRLRMREKDLEVRAVLASNPDIEVVDDKLEPPPIIH